MSLIKSVKQKQTTVAVALEDIDYLIAAQRIAEIDVSLEDDQEDLYHANDIVNSLESLDLVMESMKEIDIYDAALIEVVGNIAGASCGINGSYFTPSMEAVEDTGPSMGQKIKAIYDKIIEMFRVMLSKVKAYIAHLFTASHALAKNYEKLGNKIQNFNFVNAIPVTLNDLPGAKGGPKAVLAGLTQLSKATELLLSTAPKILDSQVKLIEEVKNQELTLSNPHFRTITTYSLAAGRNLDITSSDSGESNSVVQSKPMLCDIVLSTHVFDEDNTVGFPRAFLVRALSAKTEFTKSTLMSDSKTSTVVMSHNLASDIFEAMRPMLNLLIDKSNSNSFMSILHTVEAEGEKIAKDLHATQNTPVNPDASAAVKHRLALYTRGLQAIISGQIPSFVRSHNMLSSAMEQVIDYLDKSLHVKKETVAPKAAPAASVA